MGGGVTCQHIPVGCILPWLLSVFYFLLPGWLSCLPFPASLMRSLKPGAKTYLPAGVFQIRIVNVTDILTKLFKDTLF